MILRIRRETSADVDVVRDLVHAAFTDRPTTDPHPGGEPRSDRGDPDPQLPIAAPDTGGDGLAAEARLTDALRADPAFEPRLTLVAEADGVIVGQLTASRGALVSPHGAPDLPIVGIGPLAVDPQYQGRGVGSALLHTVIGAAEALDEPALALLGEPGFYRRFGFVAAADVDILPPDDSWADAFQIRTLDAHRPTMVGRYRYAAPFDEL